MEGKDGGCSSNVASNVSYFTIPVQSDIYFVIVLFDGFLNLLTSSKFALVSSLFSSARIPDAIIYLVKFVPSINFSVTERLQNLNFEASSHGGESESKVCTTVLSECDITHCPKLRTLIVRLISTAQTGFFYTTQRLRQGPKLSAVKYDPKGEASKRSSSSDVLIDVDTPVKQRVLFVESKKTKK
jgi:large subunit ribosomal protein L33